MKKDKKRDLAAAAEHPSSRITRAADLIYDVVVLTEAFDMAVAGATNIDDEERAGLRGLARVANETAKHVQGVLERALERGVR